VHNSKNARQYATLNVHNNKTHVHNRKNKEQNTKNNVLYNIFTVSYSQIAVRNNNVYIHALNKLKHYYYDQKQQSKSRRHT
jgi:hypothetical protein